MNKYVKILLVASSLFFGGAGTLFAQEIDFDIYPIDTSSGAPLGFGYDEEEKGVFVVPSYGIVAISQDGGKNWVYDYDDKYKHSWSAVAYGDGVFVVVGNNAIMTPEDGGKNWDVQSVSNNWSGVAYGDGVFVAVTWSASVGTKVVTSSDGGLTWVSQVSADESAYWQSVTYGNGKFVAIADDGIEDVVMVSSDKGATWHMQKILGNYERNFWDITYAQGKFIAVAYYLDDEENTGEDFQKRVATSPDGINWTLHVVPGNSEWVSINYGEGVFVASAWSDDDAVYGPDGSDTFYTIMYSPDGINWVLVPEPELPDDNGFNESWQYSTFGYDENGKPIFMFSNNNTDYVLVMGVPEIPSESFSATNNKIFGTRFCSDTVTTFCRPKSGFINNIPLISIYTELLGLYQQLLSAMQGGNSL